MTDEVVCPVLVASVYKKVVDDYVFAPDCVRLLNGYAQNLDEEQLVSLRLTNTGIAQACSEIRTSISFLLAQKLLQEEAIGVKVWQMVSVPSLFVMARECECVGAFVCGYCQRGPYKLIRSLMEQKVVRVKCLCGN